MPADIFPARQTPLPPVTVPTPNMRRIAFFGWGDRSQRQFIQDVGCYVYQARLEGLQAEQRFFATFYAKLIQRWPEVHRGGENSELGRLFLRSFLEHLARDLGWAAAFATTSDVYAFLHWEHAFRLTNEEWETEASPFRQRLRDGRYRAALRAPKVRRPGDSEERAINVDTLQLGDCAEFPIIIEAIDDRDFERSFSEHIDGAQTVSGPPRPPFGYRHGA
ncbi:hypothetical protein MD484_g7801, partial [Candolleomyces efflorescens]